VDLQTMGRALAVLGVVLLIAGALLWLGGRMGLGALPGDVRLAGQGWSCYLPLATSILISLLLTIVLNVLWRMYNR
jgi:hypothetical protein